MSERTCPYCGTETLPYRDGHWRHVRACAKNPDPTCPKCGLHFVSYKIAGHILRCGTHKANPVSQAATSPETAATASEAPAGSISATSPVQDVPPERRTATDELVLPLMAPATARPAALPASAKPRRGGRRRAVPVGMPAPEDVAAAPPAERGLVATFEQTRDVPRTAAFAGFGESLKRNWVLLAVIAVGIVFVLLWRRMNSDDDRTLKAPVQPVPPQPASHPPYNPELHGSLEHYRATYAPIASNGGG